MKMRVVPNEYYPIWIESLNGEYAIGIAYYLFDLKCVQGLHFSGEHFFVIKEYRGYETKKINKLLEKIKKCFDGIDDELSGED